MFRLISSGPTRSDCTAPYDVVLYRAYGELLSKLPDVYLYQPVKLAEADSGWTAMDYILYV